MVDRIDIDPQKGMLTLEGRDMTAAFLDTRTQETFSNQTSSQIVALLASRHNLNTQITPTRTLVGRYYQSEHDRTTLDQFSRATTEWNLLSFLAQQEGFDIYIMGNTVFFQPPTANTQQPMTCSPQSMIDLRLERSLTLARDIEVTVKSWNSRQCAAFTQTARLSRNAVNAPGNAAVTGPAQKYVFVRPNLSPNQALQWAQRMLSELSQHERVIAMTMPGELTLTPRSTIQLIGTASGFDQLYYVGEITRSISQHDGFVQHVRARNLSPSAQTTPPADPADPGIF